MKPENIVKAAKIEKELQMLLRSCIYLRQGGSCVKVYRSYSDHIHFEQLDNKRYNEALIREIEVRVNELRAQLEKL